MWRIAIGAVLGTLLLGGTATAAVTMLTPSSGPLPRTFEFLADGDGQVTGCTAGSESCLPADRITVTDAAGKYHYLATVWVAPAGAISLRVSEAGGAPVEFAYQVTGNGVDPFGLSKANLIFRPVGMGIGRIVLDSYYFMTADHTYLTSLVVRRRVRDRWVPVEPDPGSRETAPTAASLLGNAVIVDQKLELAALKRKRHQLLIRYRIPGTSMNLKRKLALKRGQFRRERELALLPPSPAPIYP